MFNMGTKPKNEGKSNPKYNTEIIKRLIWGQKQAQMALKAHR